MRRKTDAARIRAGRPIVTRSRRCILTRATPCVLVFDQLRLCSSHSAGSLLAASFRSSYKRRMNRPSNAVVDKVLGEVQNDLIAQFAGDPVAKYIAVHGYRYRFDLRQILSVLPQGGSVLDVGGYPFCVPEALARLGCRSVGAGLWPDIELDLSCEMVRVDCDREPLPFDNDRFDAVVFTETFEHLYVNPLRVVEEIHRVLKPGGFVYLTTPNLIGLRPLTKTFMKGTVADDAYGVLAGIKAGGMIGHFREYTPKEIQRILTMSGFSNVKTTTKNPYRKQPVETWFWRIVSWPFPNGRETIVSIGFK